MKKVIGYIYKTELETLDTAVSHYKGAYRKSPVEVIADIMEDRRLGILRDDEAARIVRLLYEQEEDRRPSA